MQPIDSCKRLDMFHLLIKLIKKLNEKINTAEMLAGKAFQHACIVSRKIHSVKSFYNDDKIS
jgi:hypothetical protein